VVRHDRLPRAFVFAQPFGRAAAGGLGARVSRAFHGVSSDREDGVVYRVASGAAGGTGAVPIDRVITRRRSDSVCGTAAAAVFCGRLR